MIPKNSSDSLSSRSRIEIRLDLSPLQNKINNEIRNRLAWRRTIPSVIREIYYQTLRRPITALLRFLFFIGAAYILYVLFRGISAGIEVDNDSDYTDLFSSNETVRLTTGLNLTNGDQMGQFVIDFLVVLYSLYTFLIKFAYKVFVSKTVNTVYNTELEALLKIKHDNRFDRAKSMKISEEINELLYTLEEKLKDYDGKPNFEKKLNIKESSETVVV